MQNLLCSRDSLFEEGKLNTCSIWTLFETCRPSCSGLKSCRILFLWQRNKTASLALQNISLTTGPLETHYNYLLIYITCWSFGYYSFTLYIQISPSFKIPSDLRPFIKHFYIGLLVVIQSYNCCTSQKVFYLVCDMYFSWVWNCESILFLSAL